MSAKAGPMAVLSTRGPIAVLSKQKQPDGKTKPSPMAVLSTRGPMAVLSKQKQPDGQSSKFQRQIAFSLLPRTINLSAARPVLSKSKPNGRFIKAEATGWPDLQISTTNCIFAIIPHDQFISGRAKLFSAKASRMAVLSTRGPMAVLSRAATG